MSLRRTPRVTSHHTGTSLFFPNIVFRLVRGPTVSIVPPKGTDNRLAQESSEFTSTLLPNQCVFRVPRNVNKLDIKSYLSALYDVEVVDVKTSNYLASEGRDRQTGRPTRRAAYKRAVVTVGSDFSFPPPPSEDKADKITAYVDFAAGRAAEKWERRRAGRASHVGSTEATV
ncbi:hypothetical protein M427DRAFT_133557 [Gonapodya prolifera JEL478]|uniref:Large ribosomal subunit protein uL23m n=1 Tax=Gonapodya prolifera (strain JEL478) TaxID=1344416 RepID=A0A139AJX7_GONPJ|nr:hypothetical protein M427DRAFT_133557 [Gonapodya prolifera JEL478]|eukprot:KXS17081.1 hypothetical protein M427DRAFT_133557 [Gonapodya prolifera JEL478]